MTAFILRRLAQSLLVLFVTSILVFGGLYLVGDPVEILVHPEADQIEKERARVALGLDKPVVEQYFIFLKGAVTGNLGNSFVYARPALDIIFERMPATMELAVLAMLISVFLGIPLGLYAGLRPNSPFSRLIMTSSIVGFSLPTFWVGLLLILFFAVTMGWLPSTGRGPTTDVFGLQLSIFSWEGLKYALLPALNLALLKLALIIRLTRAQTREQGLLDYIKFARAKGLKSSRVVGVHLLKNILIPLVTVIGLELGSVIAYAIVTETIFAWPGMGKLVIDSIFQLDRPVVVAYLLVVVAMYIIINLVVDILYSLLDPRVRIAEQH
ncbi:ABC transporter permease [Zwartia panacis]|uniref:ABC transporter permease n=1 Tax=Zwartia panacis TaxID=2683345 RepID=UPI0025B46CC1|nr:ABC transporter permease [Zwartia panacis]MDN4017413.1 ABC transporter permease [Zwartia panacis]